MYYQDGYGNDITKEQFDAIKAQRNGDSAEKEKRRAAREAARTARLQSAQRSKERHTRRMAMYARQRAEQIELAGKHAGERAQFELED